MPAPFPTPVTLAELWANIVYNAGGTNSDYTLAAFMKNFAAALNANAGPTGPTGHTGATGATGATGPSGPTGP